MNKNNVLFLSIAFIVLASCNSNKREISDEELQLNRKDSIEKEKNNGKYVYIDKDSTVHFELGCGEARYRLDVESNKDFGVRRIEKLKLSYKNIDKCCGICITDTRYDNLKKGIDSVAYVKLNLKNSDPLNLGYIR